MGSLKQIHSQTPLQMTQQVILRFPQPLCMGVEVFLGFPVAVKFTEFNRGNRETINLRFPLQVSL